MFVILPPISIVPVASDVIGWPPSDMVSSELPEPSRDMTCLYPWSSCTSVKSDGMAWTDSENFTSIVFGPVRKAESNTGRFGFSTRICPVAQVCNIS